jgi:hypothetical protein
MNATHTLTFLWTPWTLVAAVGLVLATAVLGFIAWRRSGYRRAQGVLELLRLAIVTTVVMLLNQPEWIEEFRPEDKPTIAVLWDESPSMDTRDVPSAGNISRRALAPVGGGNMETRDFASAATGAMATRREAIAPLTEAATWSELGDRLEVVRQGFAGGPQGAGHSDLHAPLTQVADQFSNLLGVVFVSDGDWNAGLPPVQAAAQLRLKGIPVFAVPAGSPTRLPDLALLSLDAPTFGVTGKAVRIPFTIESSLPRECLTTVTLTASGGEQIAKEVRLAAMGRTTDWILWKPAATGDFTLTLEIPKHREETLTENNRLTVPIAIREEKLHVLVVESAPRWEYRYLRNALSRDPGVAVTCLLFHPGLSKVGGGSKDYVQQFPEGLEELSRFDVVFLGDVGVGDGQLTGEQCRLLKGLVQQQASGLVLMPGGQGRQFSLLESELAELFPVVLDENQPSGWGSRTPCQFELTELGRRSLLTKLADTQDDNQEVWEGLPGFQWYAPVLRAKAGSEVLCVHKDAANEAGRLPLLVTRTYGAGKVLFMGTDGAWRWRKGVEDKYHYRFWGQVVRWMAYQRNMAKGETMRLFHVPDQPAVRQTLTLHAHVMERGGEPLQAGEVAARITAPSNKTETVRLNAAGDEWGVFTGRFTPGEPGRHQVTLYCKQTNASLEATFFVHGVATERVGQAARPEVLEEIARVTHGRVIDAGKVSEVVQSLAALPDPPASVRRVQLWAHPLVAALVVLAIGVFWVGRKMIGLI